MPNEPTTALVPTAQSGGLTVIKDELEQREHDLLAVLPKGMDGQRFLRVSLLALTKNPDLLVCTPGSVIRSIIEAAELGLEPTGAAGGAHLVPFNEKQKNGTYLKKAQLIHDYRGTQHLIRLGGGGEVVSQVVYEGDEFTAEYGTAPRILHRPAFATTDPTQITHFYAWSVDHPEKFEVMTKAQVDAVRARSKAANSGPWVTDYAQMGRKTVIKRFANALDLIPKYRQAIEDDTEREFARPSAVPVPTGIAAAREALAARVAKVLPAGPVESEAMPVESPAQETDDTTESQP